MRLIVDHCVFCGAAVRERVDELDQKRDDQLQKVRVPEEQPGQVLQPVLQRDRRQRSGVFRVHAERIRRRILLRLNGRGNAVLRCAKTAV